MNGFACLLVPRLSDGLTYSFTGAVERTGAFELLVWAARRSGLATNSRGCGEGHGREEHPPAQGSLRARLCSAMLPRMRFEKVWIEQCRTTRTIKRRFGAKSALDYLIGEKLMVFADAAKHDPAFAQSSQHFCRPSGERSMNSRLLATSRAETSDAQKPSTASLFALNAGADQVSSPLPRAMGAPTT